MLGDAECAANRATELIPGPSSLEIAKLTAKYGVYVVYGFFEHDESDPKVLYNTAAIVGPEGIIGSYRKMHPTRIEKVIRGREPVTFDTKWGPIGVGICFDNYQYP